MNALNGIERYISEVLPARMSSEELGLLSRFGVPVAIEVAEAGESRAWTFLGRDGRLEQLDASTKPACRFKLDAKTFAGLIAATLKPSSEFLAGRIAIDGNVLLALRMSSVLEGVFRRAPWRPEDDAAAEGDADRVPLTEHQKRILALHLDERSGSPYWIERAASLGVRAFDFASLDDLAAFGEMDREALSRRSFRDFVPRSLRGERLFVGETGGTTGSPAVAVWSERDFRRAFVVPLLDTLAAARIRDLRLWLFVGPTGPHPIGKAASLLAAETTGVEALRVDFDPRWHRRLPAGSLAARRHIDHIVEQTMHVLDRERPDVLFATPSIILALAQGGQAALFESIRFVHLGGQSLSPEQDAALRAAFPPDALVLNGYGNSMFGCLVEDLAAGRLHYRLPRDRVAIRLLKGGSLTDEVGEGSWGRVLFHRFDESMMVLNALERDEARRCGPHLYCPRPTPETRAFAQGGIY